MSRAVRFGPQRAVSVGSVPRPMGRKHRRLPSGDGGPNQTIDRLTCSVCGFRGVDILTVPGENFPTTYETDGSTYVWTSPSEAVTTLDKTVTPVPQSKVSCPFCGSTRFLDGARGKGQ